MNKLYYIFDILLLLLYCSSPVLANRAINKDSLRQIIKYTPDSTRLRLLCQWAYDHMQDNPCKDYTDLLLAEAQKTGSRWYLGNAYKLLAYYYKNRPDSMRFYIKKAEPLLLAEHRYEDVFTIKSWNIFLLISENKNEDVLVETDKMKQLAISLKYPAGELFADIATARFYIQNGLQDEGVKILDQMALKMDEKKLPTIRRIFPLLILIRYSDDITKQRYYLDLLNNYIKECKSEKGMATIEFDSMDKVIIKYYIYYALIEYTEDNADRMFHYIQLAKQYTMRNGIIGDNGIIMYADFLYHYLTKNYSKALSMSDDVMAAFKNSSNHTDIFLFVLNCKAEIYEHIGQLDQALKCYEQYMVLKDSAESKTFYNELSTLHQQHKLDQLTIQNKKMSLNASKSRLLKIELEGSLIVLLIIFILLLFLVRLHQNDSKRSYEAQKKAEKANKIKTAFFASINHEIRTPLNAIVGFSQILVEDIDPEQREKFALIIKKNNILLQQLISDVLDLSKIESNKMKLSYTDVELLPLMQELYSNKSCSVSANVSFQLKHCENCVLYTDRMRLIQILENLLDNAFKHTQQGYIHFGYETTVNDVYFFVSDTGNGIPEDKLDTIFGRFMQLSMWSKGFGLGLSICKGLVTLMDGKIGVSSSVGKGSLFWFSIPITTNKNS